MFFLQVCSAAADTISKSKPAQPILLKHLTADALASALKLATTDKGMKERAGALAQMIRGEDGVARAVAEFDRHFDLNSEPKQEYASSR